jgi:hypothetical protein
MVGLPGTGKTTFLAALWHVAKTHEVPGSLRLERRDGDQEYLNRIADQWSKCAALERTPGEGEMEVTILLRDPDSNHVARLCIPDMSGELFASHWETRCCTTAFADHLQEVGGYLFFLHPEKLVESLWIADANAIADEWVGDDDEGDQESEESSGSVWEPRTAPTQVQMVELLQFMSALSGRQLRLVLVVSAWDLVTYQITPAKWVETRLPLLWQFIAANPDLYFVTFTGVSAQGGVRSDATLLDHETASNRIKVHTNDGQEHDITRPVRWLMPAADSE